MDHPKTKTTQVYKNGQFYNEQLEEDRYLHIIQKIIKIDTTSINCKIVQ